MSPLILVCNPRRNSQIIYEYDFSFNVPSTLAFIMASVWQYFSINLLLLITSLQAMSLLHSVYILIE